VKGFVDERDRALIPIRVANGLRSETNEVVAWIDTAFDGHPVFSRELISRLKLEALVETEAILAGGSKVSLESYFCVIDWFGDKVPVQVIENEGRIPLMGTGLLTKRNLAINYESKSVELT
jgi:predicted aspartyl protease